MVVLLNGSFRGINSNSNHYLDILEPQLNEKCERVHLIQVNGMEEVIQKIKKAEVLIIGTPLYVDGVPAQVVEFMEYMYQNYKGQFKNLHVYVVSNLGFYESKQIRNQLKIIKNWCNKMEMIYGGGLAIGAGEMLAKMPIDQGPGKKLGVGMRKFVAAISRRESIEDIYAEPIYIPKIPFLIVGNMSWSVNAKKNGLTKKELYKRLV